MTPSQRFSTWVGGVGGSVPFPQAALTPRGVAVVGMAMTVLRKQEEGSAEADNQSESQRKATLVSATAAGCCAPSLTPGLWPLRS